MMYKIQSMFVVFIIFVLMFSFPISGVNPSITGESSIVITEANSELVLNWTILDDNLANYELYLNDTLFSSGDWDAPEEPSNREYEVNILVIVSVYEYNFRLIVFDYENLTASFDTQVVLEIADQGGPSVANPLPISGWYIFGLVNVVILRLRKR